MNRLALFDCDGTLVDSQHNICLAMEHAFGRVKLDPPPRAATRRVVGLSLVEAMQNLLPDADHGTHHALAKEYKGAFQSLRGRGMIEEPLYEGMIDVLDALEAQGWVLGVATGKSDRGLDLCLRHHGIHARFVTLQTADRHPSKPHPSMVHQAMADAEALPETTIVIGDTSFDMLMAVGAGARGLGVSWGYHPAQELSAAGAFAIARKPADIERLIEAS
jgi:phosphoglycolate phosphatase